MRLKKNKRTVYYNDPVNDDFAGNNIQTEKIPDDYRYSHGAVWNFFSFAVYYIVAVPLVFLISKIYLGMSFRDRRKIRKLKGKGYFIYCNHTRDLDAFIGPMFALGKRCYTVAGPDAVSIHGIKTLVQMLGCLPVPDSINLMKPFRKKIDEVCMKGNAVIIFPEAHIWPFYNGLREFGDVSFAYPADLHAPVVPLTVVYKKRFGFLPFVEMKPKMRIFVSDPVICPEDMGKREARKYYRDMTYKAMKTVLDNNPSYEYIRYEQKEDIKQ